MFKQKLCCILLISSIIKMLSQDYTPVLKEGSFWDIETIQQGFGGHNYLKRIQVDGTIEINNKRYTKLKQVTITDSDKNTFDISPPYFINSSEFKPVKDIFLREDVNEKILYIFYQNKEYVLCNFNLKKGDKLENAFLPFIEDAEIFITEVTTNKNGEKVFYTDQGNFYTEGIGKSDNNLTPYIHTIDGILEKLNCYGNAQNQNNCAKTLSIQNNQLTSVKVYPNPVKDILKIQNTGKIQIKIYNATGVLLKTSTSKSSAEIDISTFKKGIYILEISNTKGSKRTKLLKI
ncbi:T9SS type A sorting domain-containing protein [uncultured Polaribacter sp.]|uniref:T9SS type A sorting domain-containing protein n=1 Tax=uncultured Polaribacter sp. TaxID=174711 RepID=UPI002609CEB8|nr:T9SS type A sorting domain-containing protein [uncultured Polaribacter sp.]